MGVVKSFKGSKTRTSKLSATQEYAKKQIEQTMRMVNKEGARRAPEFALLGGTGHEAYRACPFCKGTMANTMGDLPHNRPAVCKRCGQLVILEEWR